VGRFVARRLMQSALLLFAVMTASFFLIRIAPGGPEAALVNNPRISREAMDRVRERFGLNDPLPVQYLRWMQNVAVLDFGRSYAYQLPVVEVIAQRVWPTLQLGLASYAVGLIGIPLECMPLATAAVSGTTWCGSSPWSAAPSPAGGSRSRRSSS
jgi:peptide/nickel transport system permease protein